MKVLLFIAGLAQARELLRNPYSPTGSGHQRLTFNETVVSKAIAPSTTSVEWIATEEDGQYVYQDEDGSLKITNIVTNHTQTLITADHIPPKVHSYQIKPDLSSVLWETNYTKKYRHSSLADYYVQDVASLQLTPLKSDQSGDIQYAQWSTVGNTIAFVRGNNLFIWVDGVTTAITTDGGPDMFHGVPDWVYEEEILGDRFALWFSPDGEYLSFLSFNETGVPTYAVPYYMDNQAIAPPYPVDVPIRYPKVSQTNPTVQLSVLQVSEKQARAIPIASFDPDGLIIGEVSWLTDTHTTLAVKTFNRVQDRQAVVAVDTASGRAETINERDGTDGWIDNTLSMTYIGAIDDTSPLYYLDISDQSGWSHLWLFPVTGGEPIALTSGSWEVTSILSVDKTKQVVYYLSTQHHSTERHLYSVSYRTFEITPLVDDTIAAYWSASFSAHSQYYILTYSGPDVPYQELYSVNQSRPLRTITDNAETITQLQSFSLPNITYFEIALPDSPTNETLNVMQRLPVDFSPDKKYPVLFTPYGGPGAQQVSKSWQSMGFNAYIASDPELEYITWTVDNRGTGYKGRAFRTQVSRQLGLLESEDQTYAAQQAAALPYVDENHIAIWGWSFGGYLTAKVLEQNSGIFSLGLITAPVADWRFYDSMYTERYMKTLAENADGYAASAVRQTAGFKSASGGFLIQHGTGDDNVHFQNSATLVDLLVGDGVSPEKMQVQWFTDSDHNINYHGGSVFLYKQLAGRLFAEKTRGESPKHGWSRREVDI
ncbi:prolyl dipeptidyl peptidase DppIV [Aspergillus homomorphus CBS 101889]|uniref:dipeptidyl-peptidase IV n=1 Tax=Aspergillus homomorphus (strain CBS 101889) TaxID=1450537 RepID=A0A395HQI7_ASPHC|nr:dipeptidyl aminopeptidase [Aspergillus homomorphus CBS 101889]RAL09759.1 dipeptidyl aminopeptidase [Aspergillus homomorphus CBS 101889]